MIASRVEVVVGMIAVGVDVFVGVGDGTILVGVGVAGAGVGCTNVLGHPATLTGKSAGSPPGGGI